MITEVEHWRTKDERGIIMPWYTRPCLEWLETLDLKKKTVFEYGCGLSTFWYKSVGAIANGVDHDPKWIPERFPERFGYECTNDKKSYLKWIGQWETRFYLIIIDGIYRDDCTKHALKHLKKGGYLIADNYMQGSADLAEWPKTQELTKHLPLTLYKEPGHVDWQTAVFHNI